MASDAVGLDRISRVTGYKIKKGTQPSSQNLPQSIAILAEANTAAGNQTQAAADVNGREITSAKQAGDLYGYGSPIYHIMRILRPVSGDGVGGIPTIVYPQAEAGGATAKKITVVASGIATGNGTHYLLVAGRDGIDGQIYALAIEEGDTAATIATKVMNAINNVLASPFTATSDPYGSTLTSKWKGITANDLSVSIDTNGNALGLTYIIGNAGNGAGQPSIATALAAFGTRWNTVVINSYGTQSTIMDSLEAFNGIPDPDAPTGRYTGTTFKPFIAFTGTTADDPSSISDARKLEVTIALCPAPASAGLPMEAAANYALLFSVIAQNTPEQDISAKFLPDMPVPVSGNIGSMATYNNRDAFVKKGCSTVDLVAGKYQIQDFVTTYHPDGEVPPQFRYVRDLDLDWNVFYGYYLLEQAFMVDHVIMNDDDVVAAQKVIKPKQWKQILGGYSDQLVSRGLLVDADFMKDSTVVEISSSNPNRMETFFRYKRSGLVRIASTTAEANFNFGS